MNKVIQDNNIQDFSVSQEKSYGRTLQHLINNSTANQPKYKLTNGSEVYRPFTFKENMEARLADNSLFDDYLNSCTGIVYKKDSSLVKINPLNEGLITLPSNFDECGLNSNYESAVGEELDANKVNELDLWLAAMGGNNSENRDLHNTYRKTLSQLIGVNEEQLMDFWIFENPTEDQTRNVFLDIGGEYNSFAMGHMDLNGGARLLRRN